MNIPLQAAGKYLDELLAKRKRLDTEIAYAEAWLKYLVEYNKRIKRSPAQTFFTETSQGTGIDLCPVNCNDVEVRVAQLVERSLRAIEADNKCLGRTWRNDGEE